MKLRLASGLVPLAGLGSGNLVSRLPFPVREGTFRGEAKCRHPVIPQRERRVVAISQGNTAVRKRSKYLRMDKMQKVRITPVTLMKLKKECK